LTNAASPIDESVESRSNSTADRDSQKKKHSWEIRSTEEGMEIDLNEQQENALLSKRPSRD
jgi:hypothetical protein